jgi:hypothetical protein
MKNLISKKEKDRIDLICKKYSINNYSINLDGSIDVDGDVILNAKNLFNLPIKFNKVSGNFICTYNHLSTLEGAPVTVGGGFDCFGNFLTSLKGSPTTVGTYYSCSKNYLTSLEGAPVTVPTYFDCFINKLTSLEGAPSSVGGGFDCDKNKLTTTYSGDIDIDVTCVVLCNINPLPQLLQDNIKHIKLILKYQRHFYIWNDDLTLNEENFQELLDEIKDGLE